MADVKIQDLLATTTVADTDLFIVEDNADTKKITKANLKTSLGIIDYEEGTWTPVLQGTTVAGGHTYSFQEGSYIRIGKKVSCSFFMTVSAKDVSMAGNVVVSGLPYSVRNALNCRSSAALSRFSNIEYGTAKEIVGYMENGQNKIYLQKTNTGASHTSVVSADVGNLSIVGHATYFID